MDRHALIAGVSGIVGRHLADHLIATKGWTVTGISRHKHDLPKGVKHIAVDLQVADDVKSHFGEVVLHTIIPRSVRVSEAPSYGQSVITYDPSSSGAVAYAEAARELAYRAVTA